jgi:hypothetical protein
MSVIIANSPHDVQMMVVHKFLLATRSMSTQEPTQSTIIHYVTAFNVSKTARAWS